jgi:hypothetical protein
MGLMRNGYALIVLIVLAVIGALSVASSSQPRLHEPHYCVDSDEVAEHIRAVTLQAIDDALKNHVEHLFAIWMKDEHEQPKRAITGMSVGISAHIRARNNAINWKPPHCKEKK